MRECWVIEEQNIETGDWFTVQVCADESHARAVLRVWRSDYPHRVVRYIPADTLAQVTYCGKPLKLGAETPAPPQEDR